MEVVMALYLMQHGEATTEAENAGRPLTETGRAAVERVAARANAADVRIDRCVHSGKLRAEQTAEALVGAFGSEMSIEPRDGLAPNDPVAPVADWLRDAAESSSIALVGHLPFLDRLASLLITDDENTHVVEFRMGGLVKLVPRSEGPGFTVAWILAPEIA
jgi:phosphohistidine phosphatase